MKKIACIMLTLALLINANALAESIIGSSANPNQSAETKLSATVGAYYEVIIPTSQRITYGVIDTTMSIEASTLRKGTSIAVEPASLKGSLVSDTSDSTIDFTITGMGSANRLEFYQVESKTLTIHIEQDAWDNASVGEYTGSITFNISIM